MKKIISILLCAVMIFFLVSCGDKAEDTEKTTQTEQNTDTESKTNDLQTSFDTEDDFKDIVFIDNDNYVIKASGTEENETLGFGVLLDIENKTDNKTYTFTAIDAAINGVHCDTIFSCELGAKEKSNESVNFVTDILSKNKISKYTDVEITFYIYESSDKEQKNADEKKVHFYPYGQENAVKYEREIKEGDIVLADNEYISVIYTGIKTDNLWGNTVGLYLLNKTENKALFNISRVEVNGIKADPLFAEYVGAKNCKFSSITWLKEDFSEIEKIEKIELTLTVTDCVDKEFKTYFNERILIEV